MNRISPLALLALARNPGGEFALLDVREEGAFARGHLLAASSLPLSRLELEIYRLVPRRSARIVICDGNDGLSETAFGRLAALGYTDVANLDGGIPAWIGAGFEAFSGVNVPSKALGMFARRELNIPEVTPDELVALKSGGVALTIIDCRPNAEYARGTVPGALNCAGVELVGQARALPADGRVVVTCAGRTRGLVGAQMLRESGFNGVVHALRDGTMGWELAGLPLSRDATETIKSGTSRADGTKHRERIAGVAGVSSADSTLLRAWLTDQSRTTYIFDIRTRAEFEAGHFAEARHLAGGQLIQTIEQHAATHHARIVLMDDDGIRAGATALWLRRMGWRDVAIASVRDAGGLVTGGEASLAAAVPAMVRFVDVGGLQKLLSGDGVVLVDLGSSRSYRAGHIPGAWFAIRSRLAKVLPSLPMAGALVLTSDDGRLAAYAAGDGFPFDGDVFALKGGNAAWKAAGLPFSTSADRFADTPDDVMLKPSELAEGREEAMRLYLSGGDELLEKVERDGSMRLTALPLTEVWDAGN